MRGHARGAFVSTLEWEPFLGDKIAELVQDKEGHEGSLCHPIKCKQSARFEIQPEISNIFMLKVLVVNL